MLTTETDYTDKLPNLRAQGYATIPNLFSHALVSTAQQKKLLTASITWHRSFLVIPYHRGSLTNFSLSIVVNLS